MITATLHVVFALLAFVYGAKNKPVFSDDLKEIIQTIHDECVDKTGVSEGTMSKEYRPSTSVAFKYNVCFHTLKDLYSYLPPEDITNCENGIFKEDVKLKCYMFCLLEVASLADEDGIVDYDMLISLIPDEYSERTMKMIFGCKHLDTPDKDKCQRSFDVHKCSYEKDPELYFLF